MTRQASNIKIMKRKQNSRLVVTADLEQLWDVLGMVRWRHEFADVGFEHTWGARETVDSYEFSAAVECLFEIVN
jgi:hypothetical protein